MPIIHIQVLKDRDNEQIKGLIADVTDAAVKNLSVKPGQVRVLVTEISDTHWGIGGITKNKLKN
ncbi:4-oxalocrotonate tautomerase [Peribacillus simplex]|uniref:4-oxalocrotonate tautomerase n=1 Tax=Peribacillus simplex TaxID=1478 RepID=A0A9X8WMT1_9BACI|nr:tautomerase family protein [Peribacillus simplex]SIS01171.1 4-oxalocrotonate tautomerase [Peribacillus simplex]